MYRGVYKCSWCQGGIKEAFAPQIESQVLENFTLDLSSFVFNFQEILVSIQTLGRMTFEFSTSFIFLVFKYLKVFLLIFCNITS